MLTVSATKCLVRASCAVLGGAMLWYVVTCCGMGYAAVVAMLALLTARGCLV